MWNKKQLPNVGENTNLRQILLILIQTFSVKFFRQTKYPLIDKMV